MNDTIDRLAKYRRPGEMSAAPASGSQTVTGKKPYEAYRLSKEAKRHLELRLQSPEPAECPLNSMITNIRIERCFGAAITLVYGRTMLVQIFGERLNDLADALKDWKVDWLHVFDAEEHAPAMDANAPLITRIEITTQKPEELPPLHQRH